MSTYDPNDPNYDPTTDDFITRRDLQASQLAQAQTQAVDTLRRWAEAQYYGGRPEHREVEPMVMQEWEKYVLAADDTKKTAMMREATSGAVGPAISEAFHAVARGVDDRVSRVTRREAQALTPQAAFARQYQPDEADREEARREGEERYLRGKQPPGR